MTNEKLEEQKLKQKFANILRSLTEVFNKPDKKGNRAIILNRKQVLGWWRSKVHNHGVPVTVKYFKTRVPLKRQGKKVIAWRNVPEYIATVSRSFARQLISNNQAEIYLS